jgi:hypothetical protein
MKLTTEKKILSDGFLPSKFASIILGIACWLCLGFPSARAGEDNGNLQARLNVLEGQVAVLQAALTQESANRKAAEAALATRLDNIQLTPGPQGPAGRDGRDGRDGASPFVLNENKTYVLSGYNLQIVSGSGSTDGAINGTGNLIVGYNENSEQERTGSHNLVLGSGNTYSSYGGLVAGYANRILAPFASVSGGIYNEASGEAASVSGGVINVASGDRSSVSGGYGNVASARESSVSGGYRNVASAGNSSVSGGEKNEASGVFSSVSGGYGNVASARHSSVSGGVINVASGDASSVSGGWGNVAAGYVSSILGGFEISVSSEFETYPAGL